MMSTKAKKKAPVYPALTAGIAAVASLVLAGSILSAFLPPTTYRVSRVIDGDTFETQEKQLIRLSAVDAPELGRCGASQSKQLLESLIVGKPIRLKVMYHDPYNRLISIVTTKDTFVNQVLIEQGWATLDDREGLHLSGLQQSSDRAKKEKRGIFSSLCTQTVNPDHPECNIKGNNGTHGNQKLYHLPTCAHYDIVQMQLYNGDQWFCTEQEAQAAGFKKAGGCS